MKIYKLITGPIIFALLDCKGFKMVGHADLWTSAIGRKLAQR